MSRADTIAAIATPLGRGGIGVIRISGPETKHIALQLIGKIPSPRQALFTQFKNQQQILDEGLALYFPAPHSFTGEDILELQGHGGPVVLDQILQTTLKAGARLANPGEFSQRAFLNGKIDLAQAEAIADLIDASSTQAARSAVRSLQGEFSKRIQELLKRLIHLRMMVGAAIDFPEEEIDFLSENKVEQQLQEILAHLNELQQSAKQGALLREGMTVVIAGKPNAGKSSLLNCLTKRDSAIVTHIPGTTRDVLKEYIHLDGMPLHIIDTAGLRETHDVIEQEGMRRAWNEIENADLVLLVVDGTQDNSEATTLLDKLNKKIPVITVGNKIDLINEKPTLNKPTQTISLSAKEQQGIDILEQHLKDFMGYSHTAEDTIIARRRHLHALEQTKRSLENGLQQLQEHKAGELLAEDLRQAQQYLSEITGEFSSDDLLGEIFSSFCIGK